MMAFYLLTLCMYTYTNIHCVTLLVDQRDYQNQSNPYCEDLMDRIESAVSMLSSNRVLEQQIIRESSLSSPCR